MTITALPSRNEYTATAGQTLFSYTFKIFESTDLNVYVTPAGQDANDVTDIVTGYSVTGLGDEDGGTITLVVAAGIGDLVTIVSDIPENRTTDYQNNGDFLPVTVNADFDRVVSLTKQEADRSGRTLAFQESLQNATQLDLPNPDALKFMRWKSDETGMENVDLAASGAPTNADVVTYNQGSTGAIDRTVESRLKEVLYAKDFGVVADGLTTKTNNLVNLQKAFDAVNTDNPKLIITGDVYWDGVVTVTTKVDLEIQGRLIVDKTDSQLIFSTSSANGSYVHGGIISSDAFVSRVTADIDVGDTTLPVDDVSGWTIGDKIRSSWLTNDQNAITITGVGASSIDISTPIDQGQLSQYLPVGSAAGLRQPEGSFISHFNAFVPVLNVKQCDDVVVENVFFTNCAGQAFRSEDAQNMKLVHCRFDKNVMEAFAFATSGTSTSTTAEAIDCFVGEVFDIAKQAVVFNGRNSTFTIQGGRYWSTATDSFFYMFDRGENSRYIYKDVEVKNVKPDYMTAASGFTGSDYGKHPNSIWRGFFERGNSLNAELLSIENVLFENVSGSDMINEAVVISPTASPSTWDTVRISDSVMPEGINLTNSSDTGVLVEIKDTTMVSGKTIIVHPGTVETEVLSNCVFVRIDGNYTEQNANDTDYRGVVLKANVSHSSDNCKFINGVSDPATYINAPLFVVTNGIIKSPSFGFGVPSGDNVNLPSFKVLDAAYTGIADDTVVYMRSVEKGNQVEIASINCGNLGGFYYRSGATQTFVKRGWWDLLEIGCGADWYIPENSIFEDQSSADIRQATSVVFLTTTAQVASGASVIPVDDGSGVTADDYVTVVSTSGTVRRYQVLSVNVNDLTLVGTTDEIIESGANLSAFTITVL